ncbi:GNAT family N-acetyltransferase [Streptococcus oricebi]|uniref:GNAT family N-acetyltransferase n=1 Tax=Streptococcus oricebi TaxID=1547447 RepID=A0ABS5B5F1_9STRE|nr:GNAT family N-acetyltransferase [Streptococcus oricebi]MBP2624057.1 GNAT family N-acetyltransferase [Streptococcus oricebi]
MIRIKEIEEENQKSALAADILADLPEWFGISESTQAYIEGAVDLQVWAAYQESDFAGFVSLSYSSEDCAEIDCLAVKKCYHRAGIGSQLLGVLEKSARQKASYLQVKTVAPGHYPTYDRTNAFYQAQGFKKLEIFPELWDKSNPCLIWVKKL